MAWDNYEEYKDKFVPGMAVIAVDALAGSEFKNGQIYTVSAYEWKANPAHPLRKRFWYIGIVGNANGVAWFRPSIFAPIPNKFVEVSFSKVRELEKLTTSAN